MGVSEGYPIISIGTNEHLYKQQEIVWTFLENTLDKLLETDFTCFQTDFAVFENLKKVNMKLFLSLLAGSQKNAESDATFFNRVIFHDEFVFHVDGKLSTHNGRT